MWGESQLETDFENGSENLIRAKETFEQKHLQKMTQIRNYYVLKWT